LSAYYSYFLGISIFIVVRFSRDYLHAVDFRRSALLGSRMFWTTVWPLVITFSTWLLIDLMTLQIPHFGRVSAVLIPRRNVQLRRYSFSIIFSSNSSTLTTS